MAIFVQFAAPAGGNRTFRWIKMGKLRHIGQTSTFIIHNEKLKVKVVSSEMIELVMKDAGTKNAAQLSLRRVGILDYSSLALASSIILA